MSVPGNASANGNFGKSPASSQLGMDQTAVFTAPVGVTPGSHLSQDEKYVHRGNGASASQTALAKKTEKDVDVCLTAGCVKAGRCTQRPMYIPYVQCMYIFMSIYKR